MLGQSLQSLSVNPGNNIRNLALSLTFSGNEIQMSPKDMRGFGGYEKPEAGPRNPTRHREIFAKFIAKFSYPSKARMSLGNIRISIPENVGDVRFQILFPGFTDKDWNLKSTFEYQKYKASACN